jgi:hypothetical protein
MSNRIFKIIPDGSSYSTLYDDVILLCKTCGVEVNKVIYSERTGVGEWICSKLHSSKAVIGY